MDNVTPIGPRQKRKNSKKSGGGEGEELKLSAHQKQALLADWLNGTDDVLAEIKPRTSFVLIGNEDGSKELYRITKTKELRACDIDAVGDAMGRAIHNELRPLEIFDMTSQQIDGAVKYWQKITDPIKPPPRFGWLGSDHLVWRRIPLALEPGPTPVWDELLSRISNSEALQAWIGSLFHEHSDVQQYLWLHGQGGEGKGAISRFLAKALGHTYSSQQPPGINDRFWTWGIKDARLVTFADCNNTSFVTSGLFKSLTGDDPVRIEIKGGKIGHKRIRAKYLFLSNEKPDLSSEIADRRRIIYCAATKFDGEVDPTYEQRLWAEGGQFLTRCLETYENLCPNHQPIPCDTSAIEEVIAENEDEFQTFLETNFYVGPAQECSRAAFQNRIASQWKKRKEQAAFRAYLNRQGILVKARKNNKGNVDRYWSGIRIRETALSGLVGVDPNIVG